MTPVILAGNFDLSLGSIYALTGVLAADAANDWGVGWGIIVPLVAGAALGVVNGLLVSKLRINSFLATLAMMGIARGTAMWMTQTKSVPILDDNYISLLPGEKREVLIHVRNSDLGGAKPALAVDGFNVRPIQLP